MKKRFLATLFALVMVVGLVAACGGNDTPAPAAPAAPAPAAPAPEAPAPEAPAAPAPEPAAPAADEQTFRLRISEVHAPPDHPANVGHHKMADEANTKSGGSIQIEVFSGGVLGNESEVMAQVQMGTVEMVRVPLPIIDNVDERFSALFLPGIWDSRDAMFNALDGEIGAHFADFLKEHGMYILAWHDAGARSVYNSVRPIHTPDDLSGLRIRMQDNATMIRLMELMGGVPVPMGPAEVYTAIQTGMIDGAENNWPSYVTSFDHYEVAKYFTENEHSRVPEAVLINYNIWNSMSANQQEILRQAAIDGAMAQREAWARVEGEAEAQAVAAGTEVVRLTPEQKAAFTERIMPMWDERPELADLIAMVRAAQ